MPDKDASVDQKQNSEKWKKRTDEQNAKSIASIIMGLRGDRSKKPMAVTVDAETLVAQTQERLSRALKRRYQYESNLKPGQEFLINHINSKIPLVIMYADLVGSTNMSMTLPS